MRFEIEVPEELGQLINEMLNTKPKMTPTQLFLSSIALCMIGFVFEVDKRQTRRKRKGSIVFGLLRLCPDSSTI